MEWNRTHEKSEISENNLNIYSYKDLFSNGKYSRINMHSEQIQTQSQCYTHTLWHSHTNGSAHRIHNNAISHSSFKCIHKRMTRFCGNELYQRLSNGKIQQRFKSFSQDDKLYELKLSISPYKFYWNVKWYIYFCMAFNFGTRA